MPTFTKQWAILLLVILLPVQTIVAQVSFCPHSTMDKELPSQATKLPEHPCCEDAQSDQPSVCDYCSWCILFGSAGTLVTADFNTFLFLKDSAPRSESSYLKFQSAPPLLKPPRQIWLSQVGSPTDRLFFLYFLHFIGGQDSLCVIPPF